MTTDLVQRVLTAPDNELAGIVRGFKAADTACWHIDRHVIGVSEAQRPGSELISAACLAAVSLAREWGQQRSALRESSIIISSPVVIIDDEWLAGAPVAPPPHVYLCLAKGKESFEPVRHEAFPRASSGIVIVDSLLVGHETLSRIEGAFEGESGAWIVELPDQMRSFVEATRIRGRGGRAGRRGRGAGVR